MMLQHWPTWARQTLMTVTGISWVIHLINKFQRQSSHDGDFIEAAFNRNRFDLQVSGDEAFPKNRGTVIVANHPHGLLDGLAIIWLGWKHGHETRAITRHFSTIFAPIKNMFLFVKTNHQRVSSNGAEVVAQSAEYVAQGGSLAICASGRAEAAQPFWGQVEELSWKTGSVRIAQQAQAPIVLVHIEMRASRIRLMLNAIHPIARSLGQIWAYLLGRSHSIHLHVLDVIEPEQIPAGTPQQQTLWLRQRYESLLAELQSQPALAISQ